MTWYHGGPPGLEPGDRILPPDQTGASCLSDHGAKVHRRDRVYVAADVRAAMIYAVMHPSGQGLVYEVEPDPPLEPDDDWSGEPDMSMQAPAATVTAIAYTPDAGERSRLLPALLHAARHQPVRVTLPGRNDPCYCGSGLKYKRCHA